MPLQNRVTPSGDILALSGRGLLVGNRGVLHDADRRIVRPWQTRRWIACRTEFRGRRREIMRPNRWTELFFLDEAAALSAGHRPCAECRNADYKAFRGFWARICDGPVCADRIDAKLHADRLDGRVKRTYHDRIGALPGGTYVSLGGKARLLWEGTLYEWSDQGYVTRQPAPSGIIVEVLTPRSIVSVLELGYVPFVHPSIASIT